MGKRRTGKVIMTIPAVSSYETWKHVRHTNPGDRDCRTVTFRDKHCYDRKQAKRELRDARSEV